MDQQTESKSRFCIFGALSGLVGVVMLGVSFAINNGPPLDASSDELIKFGQQNYAAILWGAWLQAVGPVLIVLFAFALVHLARATSHLAGWMTIFGASVLMTVSLFEIGFYISALNPEPTTMPSISLRFIYAVQHLYFIVAAPALFLPLGTVLVRSRILPRLFGFSALALGIMFAALGIIFLLKLTLPAIVTAFGSLQAVWWLSAAITLMARHRKIGTANGLLRDAAEAK
jgi:hypothetical protein